MSFGVVWVDEGGAVERLARSTTTVRATGLAKLVRTERSE
jgi:hypothetical protein